MYRDLFFRLSDLLTQAVDSKIFPGASIGIVKNECLNNTKYLFSYGHTDYNKTMISNHHLFYDLASLTKPLATALSIFSLIKKNELNYYDCLSSMLELDLDSKKNNISLFNLLNHNSGLPPYSEYYRELITYEGINKKKRLHQLIMNSQLIHSVGEKQEYSDLGYMLLGLIVEKKAGCSLQEYVKNMIYLPLHLEQNLFFIDHANPELSRYAPTEWCPWRKKLIQGEVHDENAFALGGVAGHAGLFGNVTGVLDLVAFLLDAVNGRREHPHVDTQDLRRAVTRQNQQGTWGLGFDTPTPGGSSSGRCFSPRSFGHLGFTGTSFWVDPEKDVAIVLLSNRVHPDRNNNKIKEFRPLLHDTVMEVLGYV